MSAAIVCTSPYVIDGDSIRCRNLGEIRLLGIDAADYRRSRPCVGGYGDHVCDDAQALKAKRSLQQGVRLGPVRIRQVGRDRHGRILATASAAGHDLSCWQLQRRTVRYIAAYDDKGLVRKICPALTR